MDQKEKQRWRKANAKADPIVDMEEYTSPLYLQLLDNLEGDYPNGPMDVNGIPTTHFGITQKGLDGLKELTVNHNVKVPDYIIGAKIEELSKQQAGEVAQYIAVQNLKDVEKELGNNNLSLFDASNRDALLSVFHMLPAKNFINSFRQGYPGSVLRAINENNPFKAAQCMMERADGTLIGEYVTPKGLDGAVKRFCVPAFKLENPEYTHDTKEARNSENRLRSENFVYNLHEDVKKKANTFGEIRLGEALLGDDWQTMIESGSDLYKENKQTPATPADVKPQLAEQAAASGYTKFATDFTNWLKKYLTGNKEEVNNNVTGNTDVNLQ